MDSHADKVRLLDSKPVSPSLFAHFVLRTANREPLKKWYQSVLNARLVFENDYISFITYDDEHHRVALLNYALVRGEEGEKNVPRGQVGVDHLAYGFASLKDLLEKYDQLKDLGIKPYWSIHHGVTLSLYYADPDGNQMEFQVDCFPTNDAANAFMRGPHFDVNPVGVEFDPDALLARLRAGASEQSLIPRTEHLPMSPIRGSALG